MALRYLTGKFYFNERSYTTPTISQQQFYNLPPQVKKLIDVTVSIGSVLWTTKPCPNREYWDSLNVIQFYQDYPSFHFVYNGNQVGIWPNPASSGNPITMNYQIRTTDLSQADYSTGTITTPYIITFTGTLASGATSATLSSSWALPTGSYYILFSNNDYRPVTLTNGSTAVSWTTGLSSTATATITVRYSDGGDIVIGSTTTFIANMVDRWLQVTAPNGDNKWYQINAVLSTTALALYNPYTGPAVSAVTYTIGEMPILAEDYQDLALYRALWVYYTSIVPDKNRSQLYQDLYNKGYSMLESEYGQKVTSPVLTDTEAPIYNPNLFVRSISQSN